MSLHLEEIRNLLARVEQEEKTLLESKQQKKVLDLELFEIETEIVREVYFDPALKNEQQRSAAINISKLRHPRWKQLVKDELPQISNAIYTAFYATRRLHEEIAALIGPGYESEVLKLKET